VQGLGEIVSMDGNPTNSEVTLKVANEPWSVYAYLSRYNSVVPFSRSSIAIYELRLVEAGETFASDVRECKFKGIVEQFGPTITEQMFELKCSSRVFDKRNAWGLEKVSRAS
jgi:hypothetical protein